MEIVLKNDKLTATIDTKGAELIHLVYKDQDYMWSGDSTYWNGRSPVLFPIVGGLVKDSYTLGDKTFEMSRHGFARKWEFKLKKQEEAKALFRLEADDDTMNYYPFRFALELCYTLVDNKVEIDYRVRNQDSHEMPFQIGAHPAFRLNLGKAKDLEDWYLEFNEEEALINCPLVDGMVDVVHGEPFSLIERKVQFMPEDFYNDALVFRDIKSSSVKLASYETEESITVSFDNLPDLGIWQPKDAPFLCIEPWRGHADIVGFKGNFEDKEHVVVLKPFESFEAKMTIEVN